MQLEEEQQKFQASLADFLQSHGIENSTQPLKFNQFHLYKLICRRGGYQSACNRKEWATVAEQLGLSKVEQGESMIRKHYVKYLLSYERKNYFGQDEEDEQEIMMHCNPRKMVKTHREVKIRDQNVSLQTEIAKNMEEETKEKDIYYFSKNKLSHSKAQSKRIILGLQSPIDRKGAVYSLNMLLLYSVNANFPFLFQNNQKIFSALSSYTHSLYPPSNDQQLQQLRTIVAIFRNLTMNPVNLKFMLSTPIFQLFIKMFNTRLDSECSKNIVDVMTGLVKVGWDCCQIINQIHQAVLDDRTEQIQNALDLLRGLMDEKDDNMVVHVKEKVGVFLKILISPEMPIQIKEQTLQILSFVSDVSASARAEFVKNHHLIAILIGILQHMRSQQKLSQFAALTLSTISTVPEAKYNLSFFETQLMLIGFSDDSLAGIIANILSDVANV